EQIVAALGNYFTKNKASLEGKTVLVTAGPTHEAIDPVRFIGNHSSGKMGIALAKECRNRGANVTLVLGPVALPASYEGITIVQVTSSDEMYNACHDHFKNADIALMAAAVADYKPEQVAG